MSNKIYWNLTCPKRFPHLAFKPTQLWVEDCLLSRNYIDFVHVNIRGLNCLFQNLWLCGISTRASPQCYHWPKWNRKVDHCVRNMSGSWWQDKPAGPGKPAFRFHQTWLSASYSGNWIVGLTGPRCFKTWQFILVPVFRELCLIYAFIHFITGETEKVIIMLFAEKSPRTTNQHGVSIAEMLHWNL